MFSGTRDPVESAYNEHVYDYIDMENCQQPNVGAFHSTPPSLDATSRPLKVTDMDSLLQRMPHSKNTIIEEYQVSWHCFVSMELGSPWVARVELI